MKRLAKTRRYFMKATAAGATGIIFTRSGILLSQTSNSIKIEEPFHGAVLNRRHGKQVDEGLKINVSGQASPYGKVFVNG